MSWNAWVNLIVGILLVFSPFTLGFGHDIAATVVAVVGGLVVAVVSTLQAVGAVEIEACSRYR